MRVPLRRRRAHRSGVVSRTSARRFAARTRRRRASRLLIGLAATAVLLLLGGAAWAVGWSDLALLEEVRVEGVPDRAAAEVGAVAAAPVGTPLVRVDTAAVAERVAGLPAVAAVDVHRSWPSTLVVSVTARTPLAVVGTPDGDRAVDATGAVFVPVEPVDGLPRVEAPAEEEAVGARVAAVEVLAGLPADLLARVALARATTDADVELVLDDGSTVRWGAASRGQRKAEVLVALLGQPASVYDVSAPDRPTLRP